MTKPWRAIPIICVVPLIIILSVLLCVPSVRALFHNSHRIQKPRKTMWLATGLKKGGTYYALGKAIAHVGQKAGLDIQVCTTYGSSNNIGLIKEGSVTLALAQVDVVDAVVFHGEDPKLPADFADLEEGCNRLPQTAPEEPALVTFLYSEMVHMFVAPHFYISSPADLKQFASKVWLGPSGSGSRLTAKRVLQASGIAESDFNKLFSVKIRDWNEASQRLSQSDLYAFFWTRPVTTLRGTKDAPVGEADQLVDSLLSKDARIAALPQDVINRMSEDGLYVATHIPLKAYGHKVRLGVPTVGVPTVLITAKSWRTDEIDDLIEVINDKKSDIQRQTGIELDLFSEKLPPDAKLAQLVHEGGQEHLIAADHTSLWVWMTIVALVVPFFWLVLFPPRVIRSNSNVLFYGLLLVAVFSALCVGFALKLQTIEGQINPNFATVPISIKTMMSFVLGSSHEGKLMTHHGENLVMWALFVIPIIFGWLTSDILREGLKRLSRLLAGFFRGMELGFTFRRIAALFVRAVHLEQPLERFIEQCIPPIQISFKWDTTDDLAATGLLANASNPQQLPPAQIDLGTANRPA